MSWIKRNLYFLVGGVVAVALLGMAGWYCFSKWQLNNQNLAELEKDYSDWEQIITGPSNPGNDQVNNTEKAREHQKLVRDKIRELQKFFKPIAPIPNPGPGMVNKEEFYSALRNTIGQLQRDAANNGVTTPAEYYFSFKAQRQLFNFAPGSLPPLSVQLGEVKAICDVLFRAKVNSLDSLQRESVSIDDMKGNVGDYLEATLLSVTNEFAVLTPYVVRFQCFSAELAGVLAGFANAGHGFIAKTINVEMAGAPTVGIADYMGGMNPGMVPGYGTPPPAAAPAIKGGMQVVMDEKPLKVTLVLYVVKLLPKK